MKERFKEKLQSVNFEKIKDLKIGRRGIWIGVIVLTVLITAVLLSMLRSYDDYKVQTTVEGTDSQETDYVDFQGNLLKYSRNGAFYTNYKGELIWNYTYEMKEPQVKVCGNYALIYDKGGAQLAILSPTGVQGNIKTGLPIVDADVASKGTVAVLMQEENTGYVEMYDMEGDIIASGELHGENSGYPIAIALSSEGEKLMVSMIDMNGGDVKSTISFYHFGKEGKDAIDNLVATYSYANMIIPQIDFVKNDKAIAFGDSEIIIYKNNAQCKVDKEIFVQEQMKSIFYNDSYFGMVADVILEDGSMVNQMCVYSMNGFKKFQKNLEISYHDIVLMDNNEVMITNGKDVNIYTMQGIKKFAYTFETGIYKILPGNSAKKYVFLKSDAMEIVRLK